MNPVDEVFRRWKEDRNHADYPPDQAQFAVDEQQWSVTMRSKGDRGVEDGSAGDHTADGGRDDSTTESVTDGSPADLAHEPTPVESRSLGLDQVFELLKNQRRRYVLQYLREQGEQVSLSELSEQIAAWENRKEVRAITSDERKRVYVGLYQCHLPKMDGMDVVDFNKPRATIEPSTNIDMLYTYLDAPGNDRDARFSKYYLALSAMMLVGLVGAAAVESAVGFPVLLVTAGIAVTAFAGTAVLHYAAGTETNDIGNRSSSG